MRRSPGRLIGDEKLDHQGAEPWRPVAFGPDAHADAGLAHAGGREHPLAVDLHHAGAAIAVRSVIGLGRMAEMRDLGSEPLGHLPDRLVRRASTLSPSSLKTIVAGDAIGEALIPRLHRGEFLGE